MKRKIKFRAWDKNIKKMYDFADICDYPIARVNHSVVFDFMQYTGFKDKNGKEIYEGDIIRFKRTSLSKNKEIRVVSFYNCCFCLERKTKYHKSYLTFMLVENDLIEIIGNIYENPELLC